ncbi:MAG: c-type cytochrome [Planctomycetes bacterium]|nr:c-type cytochrome [Planctomycetota bacterium]
MPQPHKSFVLAASLCATVAASQQSAAQEPTAEQPIAVPVEALHAPDGLEVTLWASSPQLLNPTNLDIDQHGRVWVTEGVDYRGKEHRRPDGDRVVVLIDEDGDGRCDTSKVFVQEPALVSPLGIAVFDNVVVVSQPPDLIVYTDVDRDLRFDPAVDTREVRLTGFQGRNHDHSLHSVTAGPDGLWYWNSGNCGAVFTDRSGKTFRITSGYMDPQGVAGQPSDDGHVYVGGFTARMNPDGSAVEVIGFNYRNCYEQAVTSFGDVFQSDNDDPPACRVTHVLEYGNAGFASRDGRRDWRADQRRGQTTQVAEWRQEDPGTMPAGDVYGGGSPTGVVFYENGALGPQWRGLLLTCEPGRNTIFGYLPQRRGASYALERSDWLTSNPEHKFVGSDFTGGRWDGALATQFRPADVAVGPDGAIYVADWFDGRVGGHQTLDDSLSGAIYRIAPKGFVPHVPELDLDTVDGQLQALQSPAINVRHLGFVRLRTAGDAVSDAVATLLHHDDPFVAARAVWLLAQLGPNGRRQLNACLTDADAERRLTAFRALRRAGSPLLPLASRLASDPSPAVRAAVATALRDQPAGDDTTSVLVQLAAGFDGADRAYLDAFGIGCTGKEEAVYQELAKGAGDPTQWSPRMAWIAWRLGAPGSVAALTARAGSAELSTDERRHALTGLAFVHTAAAAEAMATLAADPTFALRADAVAWCIARMGNEWRAFGLANRLRESGVYDPAKVQVVPIATPTAPDGAPAAPSVADVLACSGDPTRGAVRMAVCYTCHQIERTGVAFGPDLTAFGRAQSREAIVQAILEPSQTISHGFEGRTVETEQGNVDGIVHSDGDPVIVQSQGGVVQMIPRQLVKKIRRLDHSLMWPFALYGLDAQGTADVVAYLQQAGAATK